MKALHIMTHPPHFGYCAELVNKIKELNTDKKQTDTFIVLDTEKDKERLLAEYGDVFSRTNIHIMVMESIIDYKGIMNSISSPPRYPSWGAGGYRRWVALKRTFSILELQKRGYEYVWCLDSESYPLSNFSISQIIEEYEKDNYLLVCKPDSKPLRQNWFRDNWNIINNFFGYNISDQKKAHLSHCAVRQNDFWIVKTADFLDMIEKIKQNTGDEVEDFIISSEMWVYELWLYCESIVNNKNINIISFSDKDFETSAFTSETYDFHHMPGTTPGVTRAPHFLLTAASQGKAKKVFEIVNKKYLNRSKSMRGHHVLTLSEQYPESFRLLDIVFAVSNLQEASEKLNENK